MTKDDVLKLAIEADLVEPRDIDNDVCGLPEAYVSSLVAFAALVAAAERDAIYQIAAENCNDEPVNAIITSYMSGQYAMAEYLCERIKARGQR